MYTPHTRPDRSSPRLEEEESPRHYLPSRVYLKDSDDEEHVLTELEASHTLALEDWGTRERERFYERATRYTDDDPRPEFPQIIRTSTRHSRPRYAVLPNGQRVRWVGPTRIETLCSIRETLSLADAMARFIHPLGRRLCQSCQGYHLTPQPSPVPPSPRPFAPSAIECPKCHADARATYVPDGPDTLKCLTCGWHISRSGPSLIQDVDPLSDQEIALNEERITLSLLHEDDHDGIADDVDTAPDCEFEEQQGETLEYASSHEFEVDTFEDTPEEDIDMPDITDRLHAPAFALFTHGHAPLRQRLIELMLEGQDTTTNRTLHWTLAGQLVHDGVEASTEEDSAHITHWIKQLSTADLLALVGNLDSDHPILAHPHAEHFIPLDHLTQPLECALYYQLRGFRDKQAGARILGARHHLNPASLAQFLTRRGTTPPPRPSKMAPTRLHDMESSCDGTDTVTPSSALVETNTACALHAEI